MNNKVKAEEVAQLKEEDDASAQKDATPDEHLASESNLNPQAPSTAASAKPENKEAGSDRDSEKTINSGTGRENNTNDNLTK